MPFFRHILSSNNYIGGHTNTITVKDGATTLGTTLLHSAGDEITIEKHPKHTISSSAAVSATAVGVGH